MANSQRWFVGTLVSTMMVGAVLIGYSVLQGRKGGVVDATPTAVTHTRENPSITDNLGIPRGRAEAPVVIRLFTDYRCPYCGMVARLTMPQVISQYVETGKVRLILYDFPLHGESSRLSAEAARCADDEGAYWAMHDILFRRMGEWGGERDPSRLFRRYAASLGLDAAAFGECLDSRKYRPAVAASQDWGVRLGVDAAPTFIIDRRRVAGVIGFDRLAALIEDQLGDG